MENVDLYFPISHVCCPPITRVLPDFNEIWYVSVFRLYINIFIIQNVDVAAMKHTQTHTYSFYLRMDGCHNSVTSL